MRIVLLLIGLLPVAAAPTAELKIGFVNAAKILDKAPQADLARSQLAQEFALRDQKLVEKQKTIKVKEENLARDERLLSDSERRRLERDILVEKRALKRDLDEFREDYNIRRNEELIKLQRQVFEAIVSLAKEEGFDLIVNDGAVIYASDQVDITDKVLERLSEKPQ